MNEAREKLLEKRRDLLSQVRAVSAQIAMLPKLGRPQRIAPIRRKDGEKATLRELDGKRLNLQQWADHAGLSYSCLQSRMRYGYSLAEAISMPRGYRRLRGQKPRSVVSDAMRAWKAAKTALVSDEVVSK